MTGWALLEVLIYAAMITELIAIAVIDIRYKIISPRLTIAMLLGGVAEAALRHNTSLLSSIAAMVIIFTILALVHYFSKKSLGWGDVKLCACIALYLGVEKALSMLTISMLLCGAAAIILVLINKSNKTKAIPFAPFAALGTIIVFSI